MKRIKLTTLLMLSLLCGTIVLAQNGEQQLSVPLSNPGKPYTLEIDILNGGIKIDVTTSATIEITATPKGQKNNDNENANTNQGGMRKISNSNSYEIVANENNNVITVSNKSFSREVDLSLKIPTGVKLKLHTVNGGDIEVKNIKGEMEISNVNGSIKLINVAGSAVANSVNGNVTATFTSVDSKAMAFTSLVGNVDVTFPASVACNLKAKSDMGDVYSDFDIAIDKTEPKAQKTNEGGMYKMGVDDWVTGKINGGGPEVMMKNMNGNIYIRKSK